MHSSAYSGQLANQNDTKHAIDQNTIKKHLSQSKKSETQKSFTRIATSNKKHSSNVCCKITIYLLPSYIRAECNFSAADFKIYMKIPRNSVLSLAKDISSCKREIDHVFMADHSWGLNSNNDKCMILRCSRGSVDWYGVGYLQDYDLLSSDLPIVDSHRDLKIVTDNSLKFHAHTKFIVTKAPERAN